MHSCEKCTTCQVGSRYFEQLSGLNPRFTQVAHTRTHPFNGPFSRTTRVGRYQKGKTNLGFTEARDSEWQWHQLGHMQVCTSLQTDNHASTSPLSFLQAGCRMLFLTPNQYCHNIEGTMLNVKALNAMLKCLYIFQIKYMEAILSKSTRKQLWFEITKMLIAV